jgi:hypothetical protein
MKVEDLIMILRIGMDNKFVKRRASSSLMAHRENMVE